MKYVSLARNEYILGDYKIVPLRKVDIQKIRIWRNEQMDVLRQNILISEAAQINYYVDHIIPMFKSQTPKQILFSYLHKGICIGYGGLTNINWDTQVSELSFLVETSRSKDEKTYNSDLTAFLDLIISVTFNELHMTRLFTETYAFRIKHITILENSGFVRENTLSSHVKMGGKYYDSYIHSIIKDKI